MKTYKQFFKITAELIYTSITETGKFTNMWKLKIMLLNNQWVKKKKHKTYHKIHCDKGKLIHIIQNLGNAM